MMSIKLINTPSMPKEVVYYGSKWDKKEEKI